MCVHVCMCVHVHVCYMCVYVCACMCVHVCACVSMYVRGACMCACVCMYVRVCMCVHAFACMCMCVHVCACVYMCVHVCACVCLYVGVCACVYMYTYLHRHRHALPCTLMFSAHQGQSRQPCCDWSMAISQSYTHKSNSCETAFLNCFWGHTTGEDDDAQSQKVEERGAGTPAPRQPCGQIDQAHARRADSRHSHKAGRR